MINLKHKDISHDDCIMICQKLFDFDVVQATHFTRFCETVVGNRRFGVVKLAAHLAPDEGGEG